MADDKSKRILKRFEQYTNEYSTLKEATYTALKDAILLQELENEITESQLANILKISRTPIREAMLQLSNDGLIEIKPGKKAKIHTLTNKDINDLSVILSPLYILSLSLCIDNATADDLFGLEETIALISFYTKRNDFHHVHKYNTRFHIQIARASGNPWLGDIVERLLSYTSIFREYALTRSNRMKTACDEHIAIFEAISKRDSNEALKLINLHIQNAFTIDTSQSYEFF